ncbi:hypothetical protein CLAIMM_06052 [Cladophialophora immunda]|nr:hypothetical protein CLAIMM_06052 [Cladophialophora immunda]
MATSVLDHPGLGAIRGIVRNGVISYLGVKYASLEHKFAEPQKMRAKLARDGVFDATEFGPAAVSPAVGCDMEQGLIQKSLPHGAFSSSETECLNLTIHVPEGSHQGLPVLAFIHGGAYAIGANSWPQADLATIVRLSVTAGSPIIGIGINYRLGPAGFLHSQELAKAGIKPNRGLRDQRVALGWIKDNIAGFGGDPERVTAIGESAGAVSLTHHLNCQEPLFEQLVAMSGSSLFMKALPEPVAEYAYSTLLGRLGLLNETPAIQIEKLMSLSAEDLLNKTDPSVPLMPTLDGDIIKAQPTFALWRKSDLKSQLPGVSWVNRVMLGDCQFDGSILTSLLMSRKSGIASSFVQSAAKTLGAQSELARALLATYAIQPETPDNEALMKILEFATDIGFDAPVLEMAHGWPATAFVYHFNEPNPWDGPYKGKSTHILDVAFLFQNYNDHLPLKQRKSAEKFAKDVIAFVNGDDPYPNHVPGQGGAQLYGPPAEEGNAFVKGSKLEDYGRSSKIFKLAGETGLDQLSAVWNQFAAGH